MKISNLVKIGSYAAPIISDCITSSKNKKDEYDLEIERLKAREHYKEKNAVFNTSFWGFALVLFFNILGLIVSLKFGNKACRETAVSTLKWMLIVLTTLIVFVLIFFIIRTLCTI